MKAKMAPNPLGICRRRVKYIVSVLATYVCKTKKAAATEEYNINVPEGRYRMGETHSSSSRHHSRSKQTTTRMACTLHSLFGSQVSDSTKIEAHISKCNTNMSNQTK